ncbi:type IV pilus assembly protein PilC [Desulfitispora alkaliphila]|uniref:type II secretion system F family protein n=1 Tax=Desulfitispora alkaliphila TaxID=622674 RepID=UPI003D1C3104
MSAMYSYRARDRAGNLKKGSISARSEAEVIKVLKEDGLFVIASPKKKIKVLQVLLNPKLTNRELTSLATNLKKMLQAGISLLKAIEILREQSERKKFKNLYYRIEKSLENGATLQEALTIQREFPAFFCNIVGIGEKSGKLVEILEYISRYYESREHLSKSIIRHLSYPIFIAFFGAIILYVFTIFLLPQTVDIITTQGGEIPPIIISLSNVSLSLFNVLTPFLSLVLIIILLVRKNTFFERVILKLPLVGKTIQYVLICHLTKSMSILLYSGADLISAITSTRNIINSRLLQMQISQVKNRIEAGEDLTNAIRSISILTSRDIQIIAVNERAGNMDEGFWFIAQEYEERVRVMFEKMTKMIEPTVILLLTVFIGFILSCILLPLYDLLNIIY